MKLPSEVEPFEAERKRMDAAKTEPWALLQAAEIITIVHTNTFGRSAYMIALELMTAYHRGMEAAYREMNERAKS